MNLTTTQAQGRVPVTVVGIEGELDGSNFQQLINTARDMYKAGARHLLLDMSKMTYMSSAGLVALHGAVDAR
jgi:anti-anti-sigma factor